AQALGAGGATPDAAAPQIDADQEVIAKVLAVHKDAFTVMITRYSDPLYRYALGMTGSPDVAEDILQASFIKAYQHLGEVRGRFDAWVFRIVANSCKDWLKNIRRTHVSYDEDDQPSTYSTPEAEMDCNELLHELDPLVNITTNIRLMHSQNDDKIDVMNASEVESKTKVDIWMQINADSEIIRRRLTPIDVQQRIIASLHVTNGTPNTWCT